MSIFLKQLLLTAAGVTLLLFSSLAQNIIEVGGGTSHEIRDIYVDTIDNLVYLTGNFMTVGDDSILVNEVVAWDGNNWQLIDSNNTDTYNRKISLAITKYRDELFLGGAFQAWRGDSALNYLVKWTGTEWQQVADIDGSVLDFEIIDSNLYVIGTFDSIGGIYAPELAIYDGSSWSAVSTYDFGTGNSIYCIEFYQNNLYAAGNFNNPDYHEIAMWDGSQWQNLGTGVQGDSWVSDMEVYRDELYIAGYFYQSAGNAGDFIMKWDGNQWSDVGGGVMGDVPGANGQIHDLMVYNDELYAGGIFDYAGGVPAGRIAKWNGMEWCGFGNDITNRIGHIRAIMDGDTINFFAKWAGFDQTDTCGYLENGVEELNEEEYATIYPNPTGNKVTIELMGKPEGIIHVRVFDITGKAVLHERLSASGALTINLEALPNGLYLIKAQTEEITQSFKVLKK